MEKCISVDLPNTQHKTHLLKFPSIIITPIKLTHFSNLPPLLQSPLTIIIHTTLHNTHFTQPPLINYLLYITLHDNTSPTSPSQPSLIHHLLYITIYDNTSTLPLPGSPYHSKQNKPSKTHIYLYYTILFPSYFNILLQ